MTSRGQAHAVELPPGPWQPLFSRAMVLLSRLEVESKLSQPSWTFGGGTVLMFRYDHRASKDIDIFVPDPQYLGYLTPRLSEVAAEMTSSYVEDASSFVKLRFPEGEIDFVASANLLQDAWEWWTIDGYPVRVERPAEIIAKKMYHRGGAATARDLFDLCLVIDRDPVELRSAADYLIGNRERFIQRIQARSLALEATFEAIDTLGYRPNLDECIEKATVFLTSL